MHLRKPEFWREVQIALAVAVFALMAAQVSVEISGRRWGAAAYWAVTIVAFDGARNILERVVRWVQAKADEARAEAALSSTNQQMQELALEAMRDAVGKGHVTLGGVGVRVPGGPTH